MKIIIASDHAGYELKEKLKKYLGHLGVKCEDVGPKRFEEKDDYPDFVIPVAKKVAKNPKSTKGIVIGGSGQGEAIAANKIKGIRAAVFYGGPLDIVKLSREHNDSNILSLASRFLTEEQAKVAVDIWLKTNFPKEERHVRRIKKIEEFEKG